MSFFYSPAAAARSRRTKEREGHPRASSMSTNGRRHRANSKNRENKSPASRSPVLQASLYAQQNLALDQLPALPPSEATTPSVISPTSSFHQASGAKGGVFHLTQQPFTPAALQQYLDNDPDESEEDGEEIEEDQGGHVWSEASTVPLQQQVTRTSSKGSTNAASEPVQSKPITSNETSEDNTPRAQAESRTIYFEPEHKQNISKNNLIAHSPYQTTAGTKRSSVASEGSNQMPPVNKKLSLPGEFPVEPVLVESSPPDEQWYRTYPKGPVEAISSAAAESRRRPYSQVISNADLKALPQDVPDGKPAMARTASQQSAPLLNRAFTPPPPPSGTNRAPARSPPAYASPIPVRAHVTGDGYGNYFQQAAFTQALPTLNAPRSEYQSNTISYQHYPELAIPPWPTQTATYSNMPGTPRSAMSDLRPVRSRSQEENDDNPLLLLSRLHAALPQIQMLISHTQRSSKGTLSVHDELTIAQISMELQEEKKRCQDLETEKMDSEKYHQARTAELDRQLTELTIRVKHLESDCITRRKSRDNLHAELVTLRVETTAAAKLLQTEKEELRANVENTRVKLHEETEQQTKTLREELSTKKITIDELKTHISQLHASHDAAQAEIQNANDKKHDDLLQQHKQTVQELKKQLKDEMDKYNSKTKEADDLHHKHGEERAKLAAQYDSERQDTQRNHNSKIKTLEATLHAEQAAREQLNDENLKLKKELEAVYRQVEADKAKFSKVSGDFRIAATKMNQENQNLQKVLEAIGVNVQ